MNHPRRGLFIGRFFGIRFYLDYSWFLIAAIVVYTLATKYFPLVLPDRESGIYLLMGVFAAGLFFLSIILHELGHSIVSQRCGIPVPRITLLFIGGIAQISREPDDAKSELKIALAGPVVSAGLAIVYEMFALIFSRVGFSECALIFSWLASVNLALIIFNSIPGYPLDGGRVLRSLIWAKTKNLRRATYITTRIGVGFSWVLMLLGVFALFNREWNALVLFIIGIFLKTAAESGYQQVLYHEILGGVLVRDIMTAQPICIPEMLPLNLVVDDFFLAKHHTAFPVRDDVGGFRGLLRIEHLKALPREKWPFTSAGDIAAGNGSAAELSIAADESATRAVRRLLAGGEGRLAVLDGGKVAGIITRHDVLSFIKIHTELEN